MEEPDLEPSEVRTLAPFGGILFSALKRSPASARDPNLFCFPNMVVQTYAMLALSRIHCILSICAGDHQ